MPPEPQHTETPRIGLTLGDVNGVGPEVTVRAMLDGGVTNSCRPVVVGSAAVVQQALRLIGSNIPVISLPSADAAVAAGTIGCWTPEGVAEPEIKAATITADAGRFAHDCLRAAARAARAGQLDAICTAPLNKAALAAAGIEFPGHTEILADEFGIDEFAMMLYLTEPALRPVRTLIGAGAADGCGLAIAHVTLHTAISRVPSAITRDGTVGSARLVHGFLRRLGLSEPRIGVCALNPHGGEGGLFGSEEQTIIAPAVREAAERGLNVSGPHPTDTLVRRAVRGEFDGLVAMYHDQGHIPVKLIGFDTAVNVTLGIPITRTSPTHGTAFDIAWQGRANSRGMIEAIVVAAQLATPSAQEPA